MHCTLLSKDLLNRRFRGKSHPEVGTIAKQPSGERPQRNRKTSFWKAGQWRIQEVRPFREAGNSAAKDPEVRPRVVARLMATLGKPAGDPPVEKPSSNVTAAPTQAQVDMEFIRSLERQFFFRSPKLRIRAARSRVRK